VARRTREASSSWPSNGKALSGILAPPTGVVCGSFTLAAEPSSADRTASSQMHMRPDHHKPHSPSLSDSRKDQYRSPLTAFGQEGRGWETCGPGPGAGGLAFRRYWETSGGGGGFQRWVPVDRAARSTQNPASGFLPALAITLAAASSDRHRPAKRSLFLRRRAFLIASVPTILEQLAREIREARAPHTRTSGRFSRAGALTWH
jgi:hypothetical protein